MAVDNTEGTYDGRLYFSCRNGTEIKFRYSSDQGDTFSVEQILSSGIENLFPWVGSPIPAVAPNGDVYVIWVDADSNHEITD